jgi:hypothetical protein
MGTGSEGGLRSERSEDLGGAEVSYVTKDTLEDYEGGMEQRRREQTALLGEVDGAMTFCLG